MIRFVPMDETNVKDVARIEAQCFSTEKWSENLFFEEIGDPTKHYVVCYDDEKAVGFGGYAHILDEGHIMNIAVTEEYRKRGIGSAIMRELLQSGQRNGITSFTLEVRVGNVAAKKLYEKTGFHSVGIRKKYYPNKEDAEIYWLYF